MDSGNQHSSFVRVQFCAGNSIGELLQPTAKRTSMAAWGFFRGFFCCFFFLGGGGGYIVGQDTFGKIKDGTFLGDFGER